MNNVIEFAVSIVIYVEIVMDYDIGKQISMLINFADESAKLERS